VNGLADGTLARQAASGDRAAFAALYDRFNGEIYGFSLRLLSNRSDAADVTQDVFVRAIEKLPQLREPDRVRAWLFTIARHECFARTKRRGRSMATDPLNLAADMASTSRSTAGLVEANELTQLVWDAANGLAPEDRAVLDLKLKRDLDGADLAEALGVPHDQLHKVTGRAMERFERSVISLVLARGARKDCSVLAGLVAAGGSEGSDQSEMIELTPVLRKRIARHAQDCDACERRRKMLVNPSTMVASAHEAGPSAALRDQVLQAAFSRSLTGTSALRSLSWRADGFPKVRSSKRKLLTMAALGGVLVGGMFASGVGGGSDEVPKSILVNQSDSPNTPAVGSPTSSAAVVVSSTTIPVASSSSAVAATPLVRVSSTTTAVPATTSPMTTVPVSSVLPSRRVVPAAIPATVVVAPIASTTSTVPASLTIPSVRLASSSTKAPAPLPATTTRKAKLSTTTTQKQRAATTKPVSVPTPIPTNPGEVFAPPSVEITVPPSTVPPIIYPDAVPVEPVRITTTTLASPSQSPTTAAPPAVSTTLPTVTSPATTTTLLANVTQAPTTVAQPPSVTTTTLKCALTQAGCGSQTPTPAVPTTTISLRLTPVCCLTVNPGVLFATTTKAPILIK
jgi:RNA polymerase sigma factor (sigma-70 family)